VEDNSASFGLLLSSGTPKISAEIRRLRHVRFAPHNDRTADIDGFGIFDDEWNRNGINVRKSEYTTVEKYLKALQISAHIVRACSTTKH
jgi:hypothetical protein